MSTGPVSVRSDDGVRARCSEQLFGLLIELFGHAQEHFRRWVGRGPEGALLVASLPAPGASLVSVVESALSELHRRGHIDAAFFERLAAEFSNRRAEILRVADACECGEVQSYLRVLLREAEYIDTTPFAASFARVHAVLRRPLDEIYVPLHGRPPSAGVAMPPGKPVPLPALLRRYPCLVLVGPAGSGKTTFLRVLATLLARDRLPGVRSPPPLRTAVFGVEPGEPVRIPVLVCLAQLASHLTRDASRTRPDDRQRLLQLLSFDTCPDDTSGATHDARCARWEERLAAGTVLLLFDGLDKVDEHLRGRVLAILADARVHWSTCPVVVTGRPVVAEVLRGAGYPLVTIEPLGTAEVLDFVRRWSNAQRDDRSLTGVVRPPETLHEVLASRPDLHGLAVNPASLTCLCAVHWSGGGLPEARSRAYSAVFSWLLESRAAQRSAAGYPRGFAEAAVTALALAMLRGSGSQRRTFTRTAAAGALDGLLADRFGERDPGSRRVLASRWLDFECAGGEFLAAGPRGRLWFRDPMMQAYAAAHALARQRDGAGGWWSVVRGRFDAPTWFDTLELLPGCLHDVSDGHAHRFFERLLTLGSGEELVGQARLLGHFQRLVEPMHAYEYTLPLGLRDTLEALDGRVRPYLADDSLMDARFAAVRAAYTQARRPRHVTGFIALPGLGVKLGKYPVTVAEFAQFLEGGGYGEDSYWCAEGRRLRDRESWAAPDAWHAQLAHPSRPVVGISWYEASAYCRWLSRRTGLTARLPCAAEWTFAASPDGRTYPWGNEAPTTDRANFGRQVEAPSPVGSHPAGAGKFGHQDLAGNVAEWCEDAVDTELLRRLAGVGHVLKGGSWRQAAAGTMAAADSDRGFSGRRYDDRGFRVAMVDGSTGA